MCPVLLIILDGWGVRQESVANAVKQAHTPHLQSWFQTYPHTVIDASGTAVGLPAGLMGNSEVGHLTLGAGRAVLLGLTRIYSAIDDGSFFQNPALCEAMQKACDQNSTLHLMGLVSDGAVHSHQDHLYALLQMAKNFGVSNVAIHVFTDGRDTPPHSAIQYIEALESKIATIGVGRIATLMGRYYAMDRDKRWDRTQKAWQAITQGLGIRCASAKDAILQASTRGESDEFISPSVIISPKSASHVLPLTPDLRSSPVESSSVTNLCNKKDAVIFFNFRADRARQLTAALTQLNFEGFDRSHGMFPQFFTCFSEYDSSFNLPVAFPKIDISETFPEILSRHHLKQLRIAETEKYAHVTYFFSGGKESVYPGEDRVLIPSCREVPTYDLKPEMSAREITDELIQRIESKNYDFILCNFANPDMVGHTGNLGAAIRALEVVDECLGRIVESVQKQEGIVMITSDHGNCEQMSDQKGGPHTAHTHYQVPCLVIGKKLPRSSLRKSGKLTDIAPTLLSIFGISQPAVMSGKTLFE